jgi:hypothetical protein
MGEDGKFPVQADGGGVHKGESDGVQEPHDRDPVGESGGGFYPNPHRGKTPKGGPDTFMGSGGQTESDYFGPGQLDGKSVEDEPGRVGQGGTKAQSKD